MTENSEKRLYALRLFAVVFAAYCLYAIVRYQPFTFAAYDCGWQVEAVRSLALDGDLDLRNQLNNRPSEASDQTSLGKNGEWYPLHEVALPVLAVPFYLALGINGCLLLNVIAAALLIVPGYLLAAKAAAPRIAFAAALLTAFSPMYLVYSYSFSTDVLGAMFAAAAFCFAANLRFAAAGFVFGLAVLSRQPSILLGPALVALVVLRSRESGLGARLFGLPALIWGGAAPAAAFLLANYLMFGEPFVSSYQRWQIPAGGGLELAPHSRFF